MTNQRPYWSERFVPPEERGEKLSLRRALESELARKGLKLISLRRKGPYTASMSYSTSNGHAWIVESKADPSLVWEQEALEDWLYSDMLRLVEERVGGKNG